MSRLRPSSATRTRGRLGSGETWRDAFDNRPPWADAVLLRRILAGLCSVAAVMLFLREDPERARISVVVATRDLAPGHLLAPADLRLARLPPGAAPDGAETDPAEVAGAVLTAALRPGEVLTDVRIVGPRLAEVATGSRDARIVPIRLADSAITEILRAGDRVDVVAADTTDPSSAATLAEDAAVVLVPEPPREPGAGRAGPVVLVALDSRRAAAVAAASLNSALTVIFH